LAIRRALRRSRVVSILGARQVGKTTLARLVAGPRGTWFDLEDPADLTRVAADPMLALRGLRGLVVLDEVQRAPTVFESLRVLADRRPLPARVLARYPHRAGRARRRGPPHRRGRSRAPTRPLTVDSTLRLVCWSTPRSASTT
jgi:hypothetical protein